MHGEGVVICIDNTTLKLHCSTLFNAIARRGSSARRVSSALVDVGRIGGLFEYDRC
jgi:hypothetical protein